MSHPSSWWYIAGSDPPHHGPASTEREPGSKPGTSRVTAPRPKTRNVNPASVTVRVPAPRRSAMSTTVIAPSSFG